jgi:Ras association (RalGDS/AF-6) domain
VVDSAGDIVQEMLEKYGKDRREAPAYCLVQVTSPLYDRRNGESSQGPKEYYLNDDDCPLAILVSML